MQENANLKNMRPSDSAVQASLDEPLSTLASAVEDANIHDASPSDVDPDSLSSPSPVELDYRPDVTPDELASMTPIAKRNLAVRESAQRLRALMELAANSAKMQARLTGLNNRKDTKWNTAQQQRPHPMQMYSLNVEFINKLHGILMSRLINSADTGCLRKTNVGANSYFMNHTHEFADHADVPSLMSGFAAQATSTYMALPDDLADRTTMCYHHAARLLYDFIQIHPYVNGNGRMCRLIASRALAPVTPFAVSAKPSMMCASTIDITARSSFASNQPAQDFSFTVRHRRQLYGCAIEMCRYADPASNNRDMPCDLAAMLIENAHRMWTHAFSGLVQGCARLS